VYRSTNRAESWSPISPELRLHADAFTGFISAIAPTCDGLSVWAGTGDGALWIDRGGWHRVDAALPRRWASEIRPNPFDPSRALVAFSGYAGGSGGHFFETQDYGSTWRDLSQGLPDVPVSSVEMSPNNPLLYFAGTDIGLYVSTDGGSSWNAARGVPICAVTSIGLNRRTHLLRVATHGRSMYDVDVSSIESVEPAPPVPITEVTVYPTVGTGTLRIEWRQVDPGRTRVELFDTRGARLRTLFDARASAGNHAISVDAGPIAAGTYFVRVEAAGSALVRRFVIAR
jgi:hypothetical protein